MTDERIGDRLWAAIARLPSGESGIVFRHYSFAPEQREALAGDVATICRSRGILLAIGRDCALAARLDAGLVHNPEGTSELPISMSVHNLAESARARDFGAALVFVSPIYPTRSHPGRPVLGPIRAAEIARAAPMPAIALGGMNEESFAGLHEGTFHGWAGIDAWLENEGPERLTRT